MFVRFPPQVFIVHELYRTGNSSFALAKVEYVLDSKDLAPFTRWHQVWASLALESYRKNSLGILETRRNMLLLDACMHDLKTQLPDDCTELHELRELPSTGIIERLFLQSHCWRLGRVQSSQHDADLTERLMNDVATLVDDSLLSR